MLTHSAPFCHIPLSPRTDRPQPRQKSSVYIQPHVHLYIYTQACADRAARRVLHVPFNHDKGSFYIQLLEEVTDRGNCQEKRVPTCCPEDANALRGEQPMPPPARSPSRRSSLPNHHHHQTQLHWADSQKTTHPAVICHKNSFPPHSSAPRRALRRG